MLLIEYKKCSTCKKAKSYLINHKLKFTQRCIIEETPSKEELKKWSEHYQIPLKKFFNTSGIKYRELNLKEKLPNMTDAEKLEILSSDGMLIKRPILITDSKLYLGFKEQQWQELLQN